MIASTNPKIGRPTMRTTEPESADAPLREKYPKSARPALSTRTPEGSRIYTYPMNALAAIVVTPVLNVAPVRSSST